MTTSHEYLTVVWTARAVAKWDANRANDPRHTVHNYPVEIGSPWFREDMARHFGKAWVVIDGQGALVARS